MSQQELKYKNIVEILTSARLSSYKQQPTDADEVLLNEYIYNVQLSEAFYPALSLLEITLRNRICNAIETLIKKDWLINELQTPQILGVKEHAKVVEAQKNIIQQGKKVTNDRLIAEMTFGFWIHLCTKAYKPKLWDKKGFFELVFPHYVQNSGLRQIAPIQNDLRDILRLRNRVFHHEIIINGKKNPKYYYQLILNLLHLMSNDMIDLLNNISRFDTISKQKP